MNIIGLAPNPWKGQWVNRQQLLSRLAARHRVVYSTGAWTVWDRNEDEWRKQRLQGWAEYEDGVVLEHAPKYLMRWPSKPILDKPVVALHSARLRNLLRASKSEKTAAVLFHPSYYPYAKALRADVVAYHAYDLFEATPGWTSEQTSAEDALVKAASIVSTVSPSIAERLQQRTGRAIRLLPNGVAVEAFRRSDREVAEPADLINIPRPRIGYVGSIHPQINFGLVAKMAQSRPDWHFVIVGGDSRVRTPTLTRELAECRLCRNVHFLGEKRHDQVPGYVLHVDINVMLYRLAREFWSAYCYPLKLHEYLATGKPVVSVDLPAVREFRNVVQIVTEDGDWVDAIETALAGRAPGSTVERQAVASENTWESRVRLLESWLLSADPGAEPGRAPVAA